jgi:conjugative transfer signal peptidase TraF
MNRAFLQQKQPLGFAQVQCKPSVSWDRVCGGVFVLGAVLFCAPLVLQLTPIRWVTTPSLPPGFYWETHEPIVRGAYVHFCVDEDIAAFGAMRGYLRGGTCPGMYEELFKVVAAVAGDVVECGPQGIAINGQRVPQTPIFATDSHDRPHYFWINAGRHVVPEGNVFVLSTYHPRSWDSRYFGFVPITAIRGTARPWKVWP